MVSFPLILVINAKYSKSGSIQKGILEKKTETSWFKAESSWHIGATEE